MKKVTRWFRQYFCKHNWIMIRNPETDKFIRESESDIKIIGYSYWIEEQCTKCGKIIHQNINTRYI